MVLEAADLPKGLLAWSLVFHHHPWGQLQATFTNNIYVPSAFGKNTLEVVPSSHSSVLEFSPRWTHSLNLDTFWKCCMTWLSEQPIRSALQGHHLGTWLSCLHRILFWYLCVFINAFVFYRKEPGAAMFVQDFLKYMTPAPKCGKEHHWLAGTEYTWHQVKLYMHWHDLIQQKGT